MNQDKIFFSEKAGAVLKTKRGDEIPFPVERRIFRQIVRDIIKDCSSEYDIIVCKAMTEYTCGLKLMKREQSYHTSEWRELRKIVKEEVSIAHQK